MKFLNVDLEIESKESLTRLVEEFGDDVFVLHHGEIRGFQHLSVETASGHADPDATINNLYSLIRELPADARAVWDRCCTRIFDVGFEAEIAGDTHRSELRADTIRNVAAIGASIMITIYPPNLDRGSPTEHE